MDISRFKGLGEMDPPMNCGETTMDPEKPAPSSGLTLEDAVRADETFTILMGDKVEPQRSSLRRTPRYVVNLDIWYEKTSYHDLYFSLRCQKDRLRKKPPKNAGTIFHSAAGGRRPAAPAGCCRPPGLPNG